MISAEDFRTKALSFPETTEQPHFHKTSFRVARKIFATYDNSSHRACLKLPVKDQDLLSLYDKTVIYPVPNQWGRQGWTYVELRGVSKRMLTEALKVAYEEVCQMKRARLIPGKAQPGKRE